MNGIDIIDYSLPGAILGIADSKKTKIIATGLADIRVETPMRNDHLFQIGRVTRLFTVIYILRLVEQGALELDKSLQFIAQTHTQDNGRLQVLVDQYSYLKPITLRELLNNTSGIPSFDKTLRYQKMFYVKPKKVWQAEGYLDLVTGSDVEFQLAYHLPVRGKYADSTTNYVMVTMVIEAVMGRPCSELMQDYFTELRLSNTFYMSQGVLDKSLLPRIARGYLPLSHPEADCFDFLPTYIFNNHRELKVHDVTESYNFNGLAGSANFSSVGDLMQLMQMLMAGELLDQSTMKEMFHAVPASLAPLSVNRIDGYGLGCFKTHYKNWGEIIWSAGNNYGYSLLLGHAFKINTTFCIAINISWQRMQLQNSRLVKNVLESMFLKSKS